MKTNVQGLGFGAAWKLERGAADGKGHSVGGRVAGLKVRSDDGAFANLVVWIKRSINGERDSGRFVVLPSALKGFDNLPCVSDGGAEWGNVISEIRMEGFVTGGRTEGCEPAMGGSDQAAASREEKPAVAEDMLGDLGVKGAVVGDDRNGI